MNGGFSGAPTWKRNRNAATSTLGRRDSSGGPFSEAQAADGRRRLESNYASHVQGAGGRRWRYGKEFGGQAGESGRKREKAGGGFIRRGAKEGFERVRMRKQALLFPESYIMDSATAALRRSPEEEEEEVKREGRAHPSLIRSPSLDRDIC